MSDIALEAPIVSAIDRLRSVLVDESYALVYAAAISTTLFATDKSRAITSLSRFSSMRRDLFAFLALGEAVFASSIDARAPGLLDALVEAGLAFRANGVAQSTGWVVVPALGGLLITSLPAHYSPGQREAMAYLGPDSLLLASLLPDVRGKSVLDLGSGCGVQGLLACRGANQVTMCDIDPVALSFSAINAALNQVRGARVLHSDCYDAFDDERFDLIVSLPPYLPDAEDGSQLTTTSGGSDGLAVLRVLLSGAADHLSPGGELLALCQVSVDASAVPLLAMELSDLCPTLECRLVVLEHHHLQPYLAEISARLHAHGAPGTAAERYATISARLRAKGAMGIATVVVQARLVSAQPRNEVISLVAPLQPGAVLALEASARPNDGPLPSWKIGEGPAIPVDPITSALVAAIDGTRRLDQLVEVAWGLRGDVSQLDLLDAAAHRLSPLLDLGLIERVPD